MKDVVIQCIVQLLLSHLVLAQKAIVIVTVFRRVNPYEVSATLVLKHCLNDNLFHSGRHLNEAFDVVSLVLIQKLLRHAIDLICDELLYQLQSVVELSSLHNFTGDLSFEEIVWTPYTRMVTIDPAIVLRRSWFGASKGGLFWSCGERLLEAH